MQKERRELPKEDVGNTKKTEEIQKRQSERTKSVRNADKRLREEYTKNDSRTQQRLTKLKERLGKLPKKD